MKKMIITGINTILLLTINTFANFNFSQIPQELPAYYQSPLQSIHTLESKLKDNGFDVLAVTTVLKGEYVITITNKSLQATNSYIATLQILVDSIHNQVRVQNPSYFGMAYLKTYYYGQFKQTILSLQKVLGAMSPTKDTYPFEELSKYSFRFGMPEVDDVFTVAENINLSQIINNKYIIYSLHLPNGTTLIGHKLCKQTKKFLKKIFQEKNAQLLPYESIMNNGKVTMLSPKYYIALSLPLLKMSEFMKIATTPDQIERDVQQAYK